MTMDALVSYANDPQNGQGRLEKPSGLRLAQGTCASRILGGFELTAASIMSLGVEVCLFECVTTGVTERRRDEPTTPPDPTAASVHPLVRAETYVSSQAAAIRSNSARVTVGCFRRVVISCQNVLLAPSCN